jgi:hypothetical protein
MYLKRFCALDGKVRAYRTLVSHATVNLWNARSPKSLAHISNLYTRIAAGAQSDEIEKWLSHEFEAPAEVPIQKAVSGDRMNRKDWAALIRFLAAQDARTPASIKRNMLRRQSIAQAALDDSMKNLKSALELAKSTGKPITRNDPSPYSDYLPLKVTKTPIPEQGLVSIKAETIIGRGYYLFGLRTLLTRTVNTLLCHKWTILRPPQGFSWLTSDAPVIKLNYHNPGYDFGGGWGSKGTNIYMPLDTQHLLFTEVGNARMPERGSCATVEQATLIRRTMAEHAHNFIFAPSPDPEVERLRPRVVNAEAFKLEAQFWKDWHEEQTKAELELMRTPDKA